MIECHTHLMWCCCVVLFIIYRGVKKLVCMKYNAMNNRGDYIVIVFVFILVIMDVVESHASRCMGFSPILVCYDLMMWVQKRVTGSIWELMKLYLW